MFQTGIIVQVFFLNTLPGRFANCYKITPIKLFPRKLQENKICALFERKAFTTSLQYTEANIKLIV